MNDRAHILLVDDNVALVENLRQILEEGGYQVQTASSAQEAEARAQAGFDVALVDLRLPDADGTVLTQRLRERWPDSPVVLLTGFATLETAIAAVRAGAFAYLVKPASPPDILLTIEQALRQVRLHDEKRELSRRAQVAEKLAAVGTMAAGLSHEIRNPLNSAGLQLVVLERTIRRGPVEQQDKLLEPLGLVRDEIKRLEHLLEDFLRFARPRVLVARPVEVDVPLEAVLDLLAGEAERRKVRLEREVFKGLTVGGEDERLRQVFMNLALNALEATPEGGRVKVTVRADGDHAVITVGDSGPGIPAEDREHLFEPFFTTKASGSGLGLPIVHAIVDQHGGSIDISRSALGGAQFQVRLPRLRKA